ncbi:MAG TPA: molybdopterin-dependent oxidoreductase [Actinomycetota bacterium]|nr:molybdopterin-dependent oxidoreductase [Actinomycetota bacterium]
MAAQQTAEQTSERTRDAPRGPAWAGAIVGLLTATVGLAVGQLVALPIADPAAPVVAVGQAVVLLSPEGLKSFAIRTFGSHDKPVLIGGMVLVIIGLAVALGMLSMRRRWIGVAGVVGLGVTGAVAAGTRPGAGPLWPVPALVGMLAALFVFGRLWSAAQPMRLGDPGAKDDAGERPAPEYGLDRRAFLRAAAIAGAGAVAAQAVTTVATPHLRAGDISRETVRLPPPGSPLPPLPAGVDLHVHDLDPFFTPNDFFYRVDTALLTPQVASDTWRLRIHGMVDKEVELTFHELLARPLEEHDITLTCVSNPVGGNYVGNARWLGTMLKPLLDEAGVHAGANQIVSRSSDGMTIGTPTAAVMDGRDAMLAVGMNGVPLPIAHGFPVRMVVPGLYGYTSATKWVVDMELTTFAAFDAYWVSEGWAQQATIKTESRIDTPASGTSVRSGTVPVAGVAWAQHRGIAAVEVRVDGGAWNEARLSTLDTIDTWRQWVWDWGATPGQHTIEVRATDETGYTQTATRVPPAPDGATGWHQVFVTVT